MLISWMLSWEIYRQLSFVITMTKALFAHSSQCQPSQTATDDIYVKFNKWLFIAISLPQIRNDPSAYIIKPQRDSAPSWQ